MTKSPALPLFVDAGWLAARIESDDLRLVDLRSAEDWAQGHAPGAVHLAYDRIVAKQPPIGGLLPDPDSFARTLGGLGIGNQHLVVAYDGEGGGRAARLLWTLHAFGHAAVAVFDGGLAAWQSAGHAISKATPTAAEVPFVPALDASVIADTAYIENHLHDPGITIVDARSHEEFVGTKVVSQRGGRIPGARHLEWTELMNQHPWRHLKGVTELSGMLEERGIDRQAEIIVYCQTHHRSALNYAVFKFLGCERVRGYPGSWSEWGNRSDTPVETG